MMWPFYHGGFGFWWLMPIGMIIFWGLIIWGIVALVRWNRHGHQVMTSSSESALEILKTRYAKGEINKEEYEEKKKTIS
jgi:putative membrane protein